MMHNTFVKFLVLSNLLFTACILLIRAQPYPASELHKLVHDAVCSPSCFMGIQPGVTTVDEAISILQTSGWAQDLIYHENYSLPEVNWRWSDAAPSLFEAGWSYDARLGVRSGIIQYIELKTNAPLGEIWLDWGAPDWYSYLIRTFGTVRGTAPVRSFIFAYPDKLILAPVSCPYLRHLWQADATLILGNINVWLERLIEGYASRIRQPLSSYITETKRGFC